MADEAPGCRICVSQHIILCMTVKDLKINFITEVNKTRDQWPYFTWFYSADYSQQEARGLKVSADS